MLQDAIKTIEAELMIEKPRLEREGKLLEAQRLDQRTMFDLEMLRETGLLPRHRKLLAPPLGPRPGRAPPTLLDYLPKDVLMVIDESHSRSPRCGACTTATSSARRRWWSTGSACRPPWTTGP